MQWTPELIGAVSVGAGGVLTAWFTGRSKLKKSYCDNGNGLNTALEGHEKYVTKDVFDISERANIQRHKETLESIKSLHEKSNNTDMKLSEIVGMLSERKKERP